MPQKETRPPDVRDWSCSDVASWMHSHGWAWRELGAYSARACEVGVQGLMLYDLEGGRVGHPPQKSLNLHAQAMQLGVHSFVALSLARRGSVASHAGA